jgi:hypothetical protein
MTVDDERSGELDIPSTAVEATRIGLVSQYGINFPNDMAPHPSLLSETGAARTSGTTFPSPIQATSAA